MRLAIAAFVSTLFLALPAGALAAQGFYDAQRVLDGVAEGSAAKDALRASFKARQAELDARKAELDRFQKKVEAEEDRAKQDELKLDLAQKQAKLVDFAQQAQAALAAEEQAATRRIHERTVTVAEEVRAAKGLTALVERNPKAKPEGEDLTAEVIKAYDARYPVAAAATAK